MAILITGGMGSIGSFVTRRLAEIGAEPVVYARHRNTIFLSDMEKKFAYVQGDILDADRLAAAMKEYGVDRVIHMAAVLAGSEKNRPMAVRVNVEGTATVLDAALRCGVKRVIYASAKGVYRETKGEYSHPTYKPLPEDYPTGDCMGYYGLTKLFGEQLVHRYREKEGLDCIALRFASTYGPGKLLHGPSPHTIHGGMIENAMLGKPIRHPQGAEQKDDMIYHRDSAEGVALACLKENLTSHVFNIGTGVGHTLLDFRDAVRKVFPEAVIEVGPGLDYLCRKYDTYSVYDISRARSELGFEPKYDLMRGVADYIEMMKLLRIEPTYTPS
jgi:UDP-glucose 4-epimerase